MPKQREVKDKLQITDLMGRDWMVVKGDPAWKYVQKLQSQGFRQIVLREGVLLGVHKPEMYDGDPTRLVDDALMQRMIRHNDCVVGIGALEEEDDTGTEE